MTKRELRSQYLRKRRELTEGEVRDRSERIAGIFFHEFDLSRINYLHTFLPMAKTNEPDTWLIVNRIRKDFSDISIVLPRVNSVTGEMENYLYSQEADLELSEWGIKEPRKGVKVDAGIVDIVLAPLLAFDLKGQRVGYGKGFYDRFLSECRPDCLRIGLSLFEAVDQISDVESYDQPLHSCITPNMMLTF